MSRTSSTSSSFEETQHRLSLLLESSRNRQQQNLQRLARNIEAAESPVEGARPRRQAPTSPTSERDREVEQQMSDARERQRLAAVRLTIPVPPKGTPDFGSSVLDRVAARYNSLRGK